MKKLFSTKSERTFNTLVMQLKQSRKVVITHASGDHFEIYMHNHLRNTLTLFIPDAFRVERVKLEGEPDAKEEV